MHSFNQIRLVGFLAFVLHLFVIQFPFVNLEWVFSDAAQNFASGDIDYMDTYLAYQANTFGVPILAALLSKILPIIPVELIPRLLAATSFLLLAEALLRINHIINKDKATLLLVILVFLNPLIWTFGGRGTADLFPASVGILGVSFFFESISIYSRKGILSLFLISVSIILKYHAVFFVPIIFIEFFIRQNLTISEKIKQSFLIGTLIFILPLLYIILVKYQYGFWFVPEKQQSVVNLTGKDFLSNFVGYAGYLMLLLMPFSLLKIWGVFSEIKKPFVLFAIILGVFIVGYLGIKSQEEMNFGPLDRFLSERFIGGCFTVLSLWTGVLLYSAYASYNKQSAQRYMASIIVGVLTFILILSLARPTQRYLMFILPLSYFFVISMDIYRYKFLVYLGILMCIFTNLYILSSQYVQGDAAKKMLFALEQKGLVQVTKPTRINGHVGKAFFQYRSHPKEYMVFDGANPKALFSVTSSMLLSHKTYSLIPFDKNHLRVGARAP
ncbi:MAG: hypothetical protein QNK11_06145 [Legionella sp.]|nr:hypothetical protein [Legionella sp.]